ncbi:acylphosphatase [uncultured Brachyspira sp.]|uniref:acylphosphatase n=1 Tax=uncultured Brachyspira sp. TaxID=221953 RepID=UPI0026279191|nr:acylphosphatase [uncultured Brachyspira sp.]
MFKVDIILKGRVQGVGFRYYAKQVGDEMKIGGKVWNNYDGSVEVIGYLETKTEIEEFIEKIQKGPQMASVKESVVTVTPVDPLVDVVFEIAN